MNVRQLFTILLIALAAKLYATAQISVSKSLDGKNPVSSIKYDGKIIQLSERALYINAKLKKGSLGEYAFNSLQDAVTFTKDGTEERPTIIYLEPDVYWTDDPKAENKENKLIGLSIPQANITLIGLSENPEHTIIAGNRGQMAGAVGNWNTIGLGDGFKAYNITFGNYCNVDLVYELDPTKNFPKRQSTITQAQTVTTAHAGKMDKWIFDNCRFISMLNVFAAGRQPHRSYFNNCFFQCTDDAIGSGDISVFNKVKFKFYSNHPSWGGSRIMQAYLGCDFETALRNPGANSTIYFAKYGGAFAIIDCNFHGNANKLEWADNPLDNARNYVYNNTLNGDKAIVSAAKQDLSVNLTSESLKAFKIGDEYNVYNLLRGDDDWDPAGQKLRLFDYKDLVFRLNLSTDKTQLRDKESTIVSYEIYPRRVKDSTSIEWTVDNPQLLSMVKNSNGTITLTAHNSSDKSQRGYLMAKTASGIQSLVYVDVAGNPLPAPVFTKTSQISKPKAGEITVGYTLNLGDREDFSQIDWYRATNPSGKDSIKVAVSRLNVPLKTFKLTSGDIGYYLIAKVYPKHATSYLGTPSIAISRKILRSDVNSKNISTDFRNIPTQNANEIRNGFWTLDTQRPIDLSEGFKWEPDLNNAWTYGKGSAGTADRYGLSTTGRGARLLYSQAGSYQDMSLVLELSPQKASGQGFGSATGQYLDIYTKFDTKTLSGYGLRIERTPEYGEGVKFSLYKFINGIGTPISTSQYSSAFLPGCKVTLIASGNKLSALVTTTSPQQQSQLNNGLVHEVSLSAHIETNRFGGFGVQHTGSISGGNRLMLERLLVTY